jgi:hypothetical protein
LAAPVLSRGGGVRPLAIDAKPVTFAKVRIRWVVLQRPQQPLLSTHAVSMEVRRMNARLDTSGSTSRDTTDYILTLADGTVFTLNAPTENGYIVWRGETSNNGEMCLGPNGSFAAINDSGAQVCVCGPEDEYRLAEVTAPTPGMQVFGAAGIRLQLKSIGFMTLLFPSVPEPDNGLHRLTANNVVLSGYRIGMVSARTSTNEVAALGRSRATPGHNGRGMGGRQTLNQDPLPAGIAAARLGIYDYLTFTALLHSSRGVRGSRELSLAPPPRDRYYSRCEGRANCYPSLHERCSTLPPSLPGARASLDVLGPVSLHSAEGHRNLAVVVDA